MASNSSALPNPLTPLAFLPPDVARQEEVARAVIAAVVGVSLPLFRIMCHRQLSLFSKGLAMGRVYVFE